eukprot:766464-Hanusia_phi.AAC.4
MSTDEKQEARQKQERKARQPNKTAQISSTGCPSIEETPGTQRLKKNQLTLFVRHGWNRSSFGVFGLSAILHTCFDWIRCCHPEQDERIVIIKNST